MSTPTNASNGFPENSTEEKRSLKKQDRKSVDVLNFGVGEYFQE